VGFSVAGAVYVALMLRSEMPATLPEWEAEG
jgi:hypothetical protein